MADLPSIFTTHLEINDVINRNENNIVHRFETVFKPENSDLSMGLGELTIYKQTVYTSYRPKLTKGQHLLQFSVIIHLLHDPLFVFDELNVDKKKKERKLIGKISEHCQSRINILFYKKINNALELVYQFSIIDSNL